MKTPNMPAYPGVHAPWFGGWVAASSFLETIEELRRYAALDVNAPLLALCVSTTQGYQLIEVNLLACLEWVGFSNEIGKLVGDNVSFDQIFVAVSFMKNVEDWQKTRAGYPQEIVATWAGADARIEWRSRASFLGERLWYIVSSTFAPKGASPHQPTCEDSRPFWINLPNLAPC